MPITVQCDDCGHSCRVKDESAGKKMTCKQCGAVVRIPDADDDLDAYDEAESDNPQPRSQPKKTKSRSASKRNRSSSGIGVLPIVAGAIMGIVALGVLIAVAVRLPAFINPTWVDYSSPDGSFRVKLPKAPKITTQVQQGVTNTVYRSEGSGYAIEVTDAKIGPNLKLLGVAEMALESLSAALLKTKPGSRIVRESPITFRNFPGREIEAMIANERHLMRFHVIGENLVGLEFIGRAARPTEEQQFFNSFDPLADRPSATATDGATAPKGTGTQGAPVANAAASGTYLQRRAAFQTKLTKHGPAPQAWQPEAVPANITEVTYPSGSLTLKAWVGRPTKVYSGKLPALVYFHGGFAFGSDDFAVCEPFRQAGFVVMTPILRGENGNPGEFELIYGEVDDGRAAIQWLAQQPAVDTSRIYAFGHSVGGGIASMISLFDDLPLRHCGSAGGLYSEAVLAMLADIAPFDASNVEERKMRALLGNLKEMRRRHYAYFGTTDDMTPFAQAALKVEAADAAQLTFQTLPGDHHSSLGPALRQYLAVCLADGPGGAGPATTLEIPVPLPTIPTGPAVTPRPGTPGRPGNYDGPGTVQPSGLKINAQTELKLGQLILVEWGPSWYAADVVRVLANGTVRIHYRGWSDRFDEDIARLRIQLVPSKD